MITGIGIDIVEVERIKKKIKKKAFLEQVFSKAEIEYCERNKHPEQHFAARFAIKEAFLKAIGTGLTHSYSLNELEVENNETGAPSLKLSGDFSNLQNGTTIHISISHVKTIASAVVIIEK